jgi:hypothetical protein
MLKDVAAAQQSVWGGDVAELPLATLERTRQGLIEVLGDALRDGTNMVPLSAIKRIFRAQFELELSETALGHSKLSELLKDARFRRICTVKLFDQGYFVIPQFGLDEIDDVARQPLMRPAIGRVVFCPDEPLCLEEAAPLRQNPVEELYALTDDGQMGALIRNTFIHAVPITVPSAMRRSLSEPKDLGSRKALQDDSCFVHADVARCAKASSHPLLQWQRQ